MVSLKVSWMAVLNWANYATNKITTAGYKKFFRSHKLNRNVDWKKKKKERKNICAKYVSIKKESGE